MWESRYFSLVAIFKDKSASPWIPWAMVYPGNIQGISTCTGVDSGGFCLGFSRPCSVDTHSIMGPLQELQDTTCSIRDSEGATGTSLLRHQEHLLPSYSSSLRSQRAIHHVFLSLLTVSHHWYHPYSQPPSATKTLTPALNKIIYFPSTQSQNGLKTYFTSFAWDYVTENFICFKKCK